MNNLAKKEKVTDEWIEYERGKNYNIELNVYDDMDKNEKFYAGDQWDGLNAPGMPTPVFNIFKRVINYYIAAILSQPAKIQFFPELAPDDPGDKLEKEMKEAADLLTSYSETLWEKLKMDANNRQLLLDAALSGDMCAYSFWDPTIDTGQDAMGDINIEIVDGVTVFFGNPNNARKKGQPYIIVAFRELVSKLRKEAKAAGMSEKEINKITSDADNNYTAGERGKIELDESQKDTGKTVALLRLWMEDGTVHAKKSTKFATVRKKWDTKLTEYPTDWNNWDKRKNSYHGQAIGTGIIPNQIYINQQFALMMIFMRDMGFPKVIYDKSLIGGWSNKVGGSFGIEGAGQVPLSNVAQYMTPATQNTQMFTSIDSVISYTKEFLGANDAALGDVNPDNARALAIVTEQAAVPLANIKANLYQLIEDIGYTWLDFMANYYGKRKIAVQENGKRVVKEFDFSKLQDIKMRIKVEVGPSTLYSELAAIQTLDNLLAADKISFIQYLERVPSGVIPKKKELLEELTAEIEGAEEQAQQQPEGQPTGAEAGPTMAEMEAFFNTLTPEIQQQILALPTEQQGETTMALMQQQGGQI